MYGGKEGVEVCHEKSTAFLLMFLPVRSERQGLRCFLGKTSACMSFFKPPTFVQEPPKTEEPPSLARRCGQRLLQSKGTQAPNTRTRACARADKADNRKKGPTTCSPFCWGGLFCHQKDVLVRRVIILEQGWTKKIKCRSVSKCSCL